MDYLPRLGALHLSAVRVDSQIAMNLSNISNIDSSEADHVNRKQQETKWNVLDIDYITNAVYGKVSHRIILHWFSSTNVYQLTIKEYAFKVMTQDTIITGRNEDRAEYPRQYFMQCNILSKTLTISKVVKCVKLMLLCPCSFIRQMP